MWCLKNKKWNDFTTLLTCPSIDLSSAVTGALENKDLVIVKQLRQALETRLADMKRRLQTSWRGRDGPGAGVLMVDEMAVIKLRSQLSLCRGFSDLKRKAETLNFQKEKILKRAASLL